MNQNSTVKVSYDLRNIEDLKEYGRVIEHTEYFESVLEAIKFLSEIRKGMRINGFEVYSNPRLE